MSWFPSKFLTQLLPQDVVTIVPVSSFQGDSRCEMTRRYSNRAIAVVVAMTVAQAIFVQPIQAGVDKFQGYDPPYNRRPQEKELIAQTVAQSFIAIPVSSIVSIDSFQSYDPPYTPRSNKAILASTFDQNRFVPFAGIDKVQPTSLENTRSKLVQQVQSSEVFPILSSGQLVSVGSWQGIFPNNNSKFIPRENYPVNIDPFFKINERRNVTAIGTSATPSITHGITIGTNDIVVAIIHVNDTGVISDNNGSTPFIESIQEADGDAGGRYSISYRIATSSEPATYNWTIPLSFEWSISIRVFSGVSTQKVWEIAPSTATRNTSTTGTTATAPAMTVNSVGSMGLLICITGSPTVTYSNPTNGYATQVQPAPSITQSSWIKRWFTVGSTGTSQATLSASNDWIAHQVALSPSDGNLPLSWQSKQPDYYSKRNVQHNADQTFPILSGAALVQGWQGRSPEITRRILPQHPSDNSLVYSVSNIACWQGFTPQFGRPFIRGAESSVIFPIISGQLFTWGWVGNEQTWQLKRPLLRAQEDQTSKFSPLPDDWQGRAPEITRRILPQYPSDNSLVYSLCGNFQSIPIEFRKSKFIQVDSAVIFPIIQPSLFTWGWVGTEQGWQWKRPVLFPQKDESSKFNPNFNWVGDPPTENPVLARYVTRPDIDQTFNWHLLTNVFDAPNQNPTLRNRTVPSLENAVIFPILTPSIFPYGWMGFEQGQIIRRPFLFAQQDQTSKFNPSFIGGWQGFDPYPTQRRLITRIESGGIFPILSTIVSVDSWQTAPIYLVRRPWAQYPTDVPLVYSLKDVNAWQGTSPLWLPRRQPLPVITPVTSKLIVLNTGWQGTEPEFLPRRPIVRPEFSAIVPLKVVPVSIWQGTYEALLTRPRITKSESSIIFPIVSQFISPASWQSPWINQYSRSKWQLTEESPLWSLIVPPIIIIPPPPPNIVIFDKKGQRKFRIIDSRLRTLADAPSVHFNQQALIDAIEKAKKLKSKVLIVTTTKGTTVPVYNVVNCKAILEGAYGGSQMTNLLQLSDLIPQHHPYSGAPWNYSGTEVVSKAPTDSVDWVLLELRTGLHSNTRAGRRAGFLKRDGTIVDVDGTSQVSFPGIIAGSYYLIVWHRNHLGVMSANTLTINTNSLLYDFTTGLGQYYGGEAKLKNGKYTMFAGDYNSDGFIDSVDLAAVDNDQFKAGYLKTDGGLDGFVDSADFVYPDNNVFKQSHVPS